MCRNTLKEFWQIVIAIQDAAIQGLSCFSQSHSVSTPFYKFITITSSLIHSGDTSWPNNPKWGCTANIWNLAYWKMDSLFNWKHISYPFNIWAVVSPIKTLIYIEGFCVWNVCFGINWLSSNITNLMLMSWPFREIKFHLLNYWLFAVQFLC